MPKVRLSFDISGRVTQTVNVPQSVVDTYKSETTKGSFDDRRLDQLLGAYINYGDILDQLDDPEDIELTIVEEAAPESAE